MSGNEFISHPQKGGIYIEKWRLDLDWKENEKRKGGWGPISFELNLKAEAEAERPQRAGFSARLSQKPAEAKLKAAARTSVRNRAAIKASAKDTFLIRQAGKLP